MGFLRGVPPNTATLTMQAEFGDVYQYWIGPLRVIGVCNVEDIQYIFAHRHIYEKSSSHMDRLRVFLPDSLVSTTGANYKRHATIVLSLFRGAKVLSNLHLIYDCTDKLLDVWRSQADDPSYIHLDMVKDCQNLLLDIFGFIGFDYDLQTLGNDDSSQSNRLKKSLKDYLDVIALALLLPVTIAKIYVKFNSRYRQALNVIREYTDRIIEQEQSKGSETILERKRKCLIASLVGSRQQDEKIELALPEEKRKGLSSKEIFEEILLFLVAGSETTSTALSWFIHLTSKNPRVQAKIKAELGDNRQHYLSIEQLDSLEYLDCVIQEVLRFVPPAISTIRSVTSDDRLPASGAQLYKDDEVIINIYNLTRDKRYWKIDPDLFYPERFQGEDKDHHPFTLIPFGGGHRQCIGQDLARFELKAIIARLMQRVTFGDGGPQNHLKLSHADYNPPESISFSNQLQLLAEVDHLS
ncbi:unnamed protein product [Rotaria sordida]|uniref:Cytochrome P450 n=1 Tax=Rotaria sordida TaxID=392033 RepID=A0A813RPC5_9BILA|nr:unnamed protein product [Rotaria sordida]CAF1025495.1 unnamed protein product [Rotaria sordida]